MGPRLYPHGIGGPLNQAPNDIRDDPLSGDVVLLRGEYHGLYRCRVGPGRIHFLAMANPLCHEPSLISCDGPPKVGW